MTEDNDIIDLTESCPFCRKNLNDEDHNERECLQGVYRAVIEANANYERLGREPQEIERRRTRWDRFRSFFGYDLGEIMKTITLFAKLIVYVYLILALQRFIEHGLSF